MIKITKNLVLIILIGTCIKLCLWQIDRAEQKLSIQNDFNIQKELAPINVLSIKSQPNRFTNIFATGYFNETYFLLDNIVHNRIAGYHVIHPLLIDDKILLINRGWVENYSRQKFPSITGTGELVTLSGYVYYPSKLLELSDQNMTKSKPYVIQNIDISEISSVLKKKVHPYILILEGGTKYSYVNQNINDEKSHLKHYMYAGQWFLFSVIGVIFLILLNRRENE